MAQPTISFLTLGLGHPQHGHPISSTASPSQRLTLFRITISKLLSVNSGDNRPRSYPSHGVQEPDINHFGKILGILSNKGHNDVRHQQTDFGLAQAEFITSVRELGSI